MWNEKYKKRIKGKIKGFIRALLTEMTKNNVYVISDGIGEGFSVKGGINYLRIRHPQREELFLSKLNLHSKTVYDIGSYIGILTMFFAKAGGPNANVISFEANPMNYLSQKKNIELNGLENVKILRIGIGDRHEKKTLFFNKYYSATGTVNENIKSLLLSNFWKNVFARTRVIEIDTLDSCLKRFDLPAPDFVKIDIEGHEYYALLGMTQILSTYKPSLYIEIHGENQESKYQKVRKIFNFLSVYEYSFYHVESDNRINLANLHKAKGGHIYCE